MFGLICAGRLVQTDITQVDTNRFIFPIIDAVSVNHLVVFLLGHTPFPPGFAASVHFLWPNIQPAAGPPTWIFLGILTNEKPSAIFKLGGSKTSSGYSKSMDDLMEDDRSSYPGSETVAQLGISIEPIVNVQQAYEALTQSKNITSMTSLRTPQESPTLTVNKILESFYNYCTSFSSALPPGKMVNFNPKVVWPCSTLEPILI
jgi:hypothetical protein